MSDLNIAMWTIGQHAMKNILPAITNSKSVNLKGIFTRNKKILYSISEKYNCYAYNNINDLLSDRDLHAVYISSPNSEHYNQVKQCLLNNKHVIVEKTSFTNYEEAKEIVDLAKSKKLLVMEAFMFLHHNQFFHVKNLLKTQKYGEILFIESSFGIPHLEKKNIRYSKKLAGGALNDLGTYTVRSVMEIFDFNANLLFSSQEIEKGYEVDTSGIAIFSIKNTKAICKWAFGSSYKNEINIWCEKSHILVERAFSKPDTFSSNIKIMNNGELIEEVIVGKDNHFIKMIDYFANCILNSFNNRNLNNILLQSKLLFEIKNNSQKI